MSFKRTAGMREHAVAPSVIAAANTAVGDLAVGDCGWCSGRLRTQAVRLIDM